MEKIDKAKLEAMKALERAKEEPKISKDVIEDIKQAHRDFLARQERLEQETASSTFTTAQERPKRGYVDDTSSVLRPDKTGGHPRRNIRIRIPYHMGIGEAIVSCFEKYATFKGRARRAEYWYFMLFTLALYALVLYLFQLLWLTPKVTLILILLIFAATIMPTWAVTVRRFHDINRSGWYLTWIIFPCIYSILTLPFLLLWQASEFELFIARGCYFIAGGCCLIGFIIVFVFAITRSSEGENQYGPSPMYKDIEIISHEEGTD